MSDDDQWGPWIEHDGKGCPCVGMTVEVIDDEPDQFVIERVTGENGWDNRSYEWNVIFYRIRKPKGLSILTDILREVERDGDKVYSGGEMEESRV